MPRPESPGASPTPSTNPVARRPDPLEGPQPPPRPPESRPGGVSTSDASVGKFPKWLLFPIVSFAVLVIVALLIEIPGGSDDDSRRPRVRAPTSTPASPATEAPLDGRDNSAEALSFWNGVEAVGLPSTIPFDEVKFDLMNALFVIFDEHFTKLEGIGIDPFSVWPYCITAISSMDSVARLTQAESPSEASLYSNVLFEFVEVLDLELMAAREDERQATASSREQCDGYFEDVMRRGGAANVTP